MSTSDSIPATPSPLVKPPVYWEPPAEFTMQAPQGIRYDFNKGLRISFPKDSGDHWFILTDQDTGTVFYNGLVKAGGKVFSSKMYFLNYKLQILSSDRKELLFTHYYDASQKDVVINFPDGAIGDTLGWFSYVQRFQQKHHCKLHCIMPGHIKELLQKQYPDIYFYSVKESIDLKPYATYYMGLFFGGNTQWQPIDFRQVGLHKTAAHILDVSDEDIPPRVDLSAKRKIKEKYCVISTQASSQTKHWNNPCGWDSVIRFLKEEGYKVYCINKDRNYGNGLIWNHVPWGVEDATGALPLQQRINLIKDADFFIGLGSGMSWLAWCCRVPVVLISGFSLPSCEFYTPYRVINYNVCNGCWDDKRFNFDHKDYLWCPKYKGTPRQFECTMGISGEQVIRTIKKIPSFKPLQ